MNRAIATLCATVLLCTAGAAQQPADVLQQLKFPLEGSAHQMMAQSTAKSCMATPQIQKAGFSPDRVEIVCDCYGDVMASTVTKEDAMALFTGQPTDSVRAKAKAAADQCVAKAARK